MVSKWNQSFLIVAAASLLPQLPALAQEDTNYQGYDKSFIDRPDHKKPTNPFALKGSDFHKHSYRRMLLNSEFAGSSVGLGVNASNQVYNRNAYTYLNPDSYKANDATPEEVNRYIDQVYTPNVGKSTNQGYQVNKNFDQENPFKTGSQSQLSEDNPFGNTFDAGPSSPFLQKDYLFPKKKRSSANTSSSDSSYRPTALPGSNENSYSRSDDADTSKSNF